MNDAATQSSDTNNVKLIYILYLASILLGITSIIGVIMAYVNKNGDTGVLNNHYRYQIRTFWMCLLYGFVSSLLIPVMGLGLLLMVATLIWFIIRCAKGLKAAGENREVENVTSWMI